MIRLTITSRAVSAVVTSIVCVCSTTALSCSSASSDNLNFALGTAHHLSETEQNVGAAFRLGQSNDTGPVASHFGDDEEDFGSHNWFRDVSDRARSWTASKDRRRARLHLKNVRAVESMEVLRTRISADGIARISCRHTNLAESKVDAFFGVGFRSEPASQGFGVHIENKRQNERDGESLACNDGKPNGDGRWQIQVDYKKRR
jgi:hypothetical protein